LRVVSCANKAFACTLEQISSVSNSSLSGYEFTEGAREQIERLYVQHAQKAFDPASFVGLRLLVRSAGDRAINVLADFPELWEIFGKKGKIAERIEPLTLGEGGYKLSDVARKYN